MKPGDLFLFWRVFRRVDEALRWCGRPMHVLWGGYRSVMSRPSTMSCAQIGREPGAGRRRIRISLSNRIPSNTLYVAGDQLELPGLEGLNLPAAGAFDVFTEQRVLTAEDAARPSLWSLPAWFLPRGRPPLSYHGEPHRWQEHPLGVQLEVVARGQEFVLNAGHYPEAAGWVPSRSPGADAVTGLQAPR